MNFTSKAISLSTLSISLPLRPCSLMCVLLLLPNRAPSPPLTPLSLSAPPFSLGLPLLVRGGSHNPIYSILFPLNLVFCKHVFYYFHIIFTYPLLQILLLSPQFDWSESDEFKVEIAKPGWLSLVPGPSFSKWISKNLHWSHCDN